MSKLHDEGVEVVPLTGGTRYILPARREKGMRTLGWVFTGFGGFITAFMVFWMSGPFMDFLREQGPGRWSSLAFAMTGIFGLVPGLAMLLGGLGLAAGWSRCTVEVTADKIRLIERSGIIRWSWTRKTADLMSLVSCGRETPASPQTDSLSRTSYVVNCIAAVGREPGASQLTIGAGYPCSLLGLLEAELSEKTGLPLDKSAEEDEDEAVDPVEAAATADRLAAERPPQTDIVLQDLPDGVGLSVPPAGLWRGTKGLFLFALIWDAMVSGFLVILIVSMVRDGPKGGAPPFIVFLFVGVFATIGVALLLTAINMGKRRALIAVSGGVLTIRRIGPFGTKEHRFARGEVLAVRIGPSGILVNDKPLMELQVLPAGGKKVGILSQRKEEELLWLAAILRQVLKVGAEPPQ
jgi:hypothetical protein